MVTNYVTIRWLSEHSEWQCSYTKTQRGQRVLQQHLHEIAKSLSQLYWSTSGTEGQNVSICNATPVTLLWLVHMVFSTASCNIRTSANRHTILQSLVVWEKHIQCQTTVCCEKCHHREEMSNVSTFQSHFKTCHYSVVCPSFKLKGVNILGLI